MKTIKNYHTKCTVVVNVMMPDNAIILSARTIDGTDVLVISALIDDDTPDLERTFELYGEGDVMPGKFNGKYIGSINGNTLHIFENTEAYETFHLESQKIHETV